MLQKCFKYYKIVFQNRQSGTNRHFILLFLEQNEAKNCFSWVYD